MELFTSNSKYSRIAYMIDTRLPEQCSFKRMHGYTHQNNAQREGLESRPDGKGCQKRMRLRRWTQQSLSSARFLEIGCFLRSQNIITLTRTGTQSHNLMICQEGTVFSSSQFEQHSLANATFARINVPCSILNVSYERTTLSLENSCFNGNKEPLNRKGHVQNLRKIHQPIIKLPWKTTSPLTVHDVVRNIINETFTAFCGFCVEQCGRVKNLDNNRCSRAFSR